VSDVTIAFPRALAEEANKALSELIAWTNGLAAATHGLAPAPDGLHGVYLVQRMLRRELEKLPSWAAELAREERARCVSLIREAGRQAVTPTEGARLMALAADIDGGQGDDLRG
jgi:hypothetical protein